MTNSDRKTAWVVAKRKKDIRFYPLLVVVGAVARFFYRLRHWDWSDWTPPPARSLAETVSQFSDPVYGLVGNFMGLDPGGRSYGGSSVGLNYQQNWLANEDARPGVSLETKKIAAADDPLTATALHVRMAAFGVTWEYNSRSFREGWVGRMTDPMTFMDQFPSEVLQRVPVEIAGFPSETTAWRWEVPQPVHVALLRNATCQLTIATFGLCSPDFTELTSHVRPLNAEEIERREVAAEARAKEYERRMLENDE